MVDDSLDSLLERLSVRCSAVGRKVMMGNPGDPQHFVRRMNTPDPECEVIGND